MDPSDGGCLFCETESEDMLFSFEFDCWVHEDCVREKLKEGNIEAKIIAEELEVR